jgi:hypothetical protein
MLMMPLPRRLWIRSEKRIGGKALRLTIGAINENGLFGTAWWLLQPQ